MKKYIIVSLLMLGIIIPSVSFAQTTSGNINTQVNSCVMLTYKLKYGSKDIYTNGEVTMLQNFLRSKNYFSYTVDGKFGPLTRASVIAWQRSVALGADGIVGPLTRAKIKLVTCDTSTNITSVTVLSPNGGETFQKGSTQRFTLSTTGIFPSTATAAFSLEGGSTNGVIGGTMARNSSGIYEVTLPDTHITQGDVLVPFALGSYKLKATIYDKTPCLGLCAYPNSAQVLAEDSSNGYIKILSTTSSSGFTITTPSTLPDTYIGGTYSESISATGGSGSYEWNVVSGSLPDGLTLTQAQCFAAPCQVPVTISGTPTKAGTFKFTIQVISSPLVGDGPTLVATKEFTINVVIGR